MRKLYLDNGNEQFKFADTTTEIRLNAFDDGCLASLTANTKVRVKNDSGYLLEVSPSVTKNQAVITSGQLAQLPAGNYLLELWDTVDGGTAIYPSDGFLRLQINENVTGLSGKLVSSITVDDFIKQFNDLSQQLKKEASALPLSIDQKWTINGALHATQYVYDESSLANFKDADKLPRNSIVSYVYGMEKLVNVPTGDTGTIITLSSKEGRNYDGDNTTVQLAVTEFGDFYVRRKWNSWGDWQKLNNTEVNIYTSSLLVSPYTDASTLPTGSMVTYSNGNFPSNLPVQGGNWVQIYTSDSHAGVITQTYQNMSGDCYIRHFNENGKGERLNFIDWKKINSNTEVNIYTSSLLVSPYTDASTLPTGSMVTYSNGNFPSNLPVQGGNWVQIYTSDSHAGVITQTYQNMSGDCYIRHFNENGKGERLNFIDWKKINSNTEVETKSTESFASFSIFSKFAVIGDSYASAALSSNTQSSVFQDGGSAHRWGQMIAAKYGLTYTHLAQGGLSTRTWLTSDSGLKAMQSADPQDLYMLCLGINDYYGLGLDYLGSEADMESGADTFYGNYSKIIKAIQAKAPKGKLIMYGVAADSSVANSFRDAQQKIAARFGIPFISEGEDPLFVSDFYTSNMEGGHPRVPVYGAMSKAMVRLTEKVIDQNENYFHDIGWN